MRILANYGRRNNGDSYNVTFEQMGDVPMESAEETIDFNFKPRQISIVNNSSTNDLKVKLNTSETFITVRMGEQVSLAVAHKKLIIKADDGVTPVAYRIWGIG